MLEELIKEQKILLERIVKIGGYLKVEDKKKQVEALKEKTQSQDLWADPDRAKNLLRDLSMLEKEIAEWEAVRSQVEDMETLIGMADQKDESQLKEELQKLRQRASALELKALLNGPYDKNNAIMYINAGAGGTDAQDWAQILMRMYVRWAESKEYKVEIPEISYGDEAGIKGATLLINGEYAYGYLKCEKGIHRLVRLSPFNSDGKRHTSFASVEIIPEITEELKVDIDPADLRVDTYRASGPGGQNVNKVSSAVRITHIPTGMVTQSQSDRSQQANRETAMKLLKAKLFEQLTAERKEKIEELQGEKRAIEWGSQIRSYVFQPYTMVKDHRTGVEIGNVQSVIDGDIDMFIEGMLKKGA
ncbi:MAG: peptide chain release factor 2 [Candidatus Margulisiibacteriota bacterium]